MYGIIDLSTYVMGTVAVILLPGPNSMFCLAMAGQYGAKTAYQAVAGIFVGDSVLMLLTALGAASVLKTNPTLFLILKLLGGLYLAYIGINLLRAAVQKWRTSAPSIAQVLAEVPMTQQAPKHVFQRALLLSLLNPKAILFFLSFFVQFVDVSYAHPALSFLILALILQFTSMVYLSVLIVSGVSLVSWFGRQQRLAASGMALVGMMFVGFAAKMWAASTS